MYNPLVVPRSSVPWEDAKQLNRHRSDMPFGKKSWGDDSPQDFANAPYLDSANGFSADTYSSVTQTLTEQARLSLALLQEQDKKVAFENQFPTVKTSASVNAHLPFVMDDYAAAKRIKVLLAKGLLSKTISGKFVDAAPADPDESNSPSPHFLADTHPAEGDVPAHDESHDTAFADSGSIDVMPEAATDNRVDLAELAQREEAQFAKGLAQGIEEGKALGFESGFAKGLEEGKASGLEEGKALGLEEGKGLGLEEAVQQALEKGRAEGLEEGRLQGLEQGARQSREAMEQEVATQCEVLAQAAQGLSDLLQDPQQLFAPLKRLALHMAQHIAKHELRTSPAAIDALVQNCLNALDHPIKGAVIVELNPQDKKLLEALVTTRLEGVHLEAVPQLQSGSVRVIANDMVVEDLIENRMEALARGLALVQPTSQRSLTATPSREPVTVLADKVEEENKPVEAPSTDPDVNEEAGDVHP